MSYTIAVEPQRGVGGRGMSKQELAYRTIRKRIIEGVYGPGYRLVIDELARELGCSAIPVREALRRLEAEGLLEFVKNAGARVVSIDPLEYCDVLSTLAVLEGYATVLAAPHMTPEDFQKLRALEAEMERAVGIGDMLHYSQLNRAYHEAIYERCPNRYLVSQIELAWARLDSMRHSIFVLLPARARSSLEDHRRITTLLEQGGPADEIERVVRDHKLATLEAFRRWSVESGRTVSVLT